MTTYDILHNRIMRRVYYAYALRLLTGPVALHGAVIAVLLFILTYFVSVTNVLRNISHIEVGRVGSYILESALHTEVWTLLIIGALIFAAFSLRINLRRQPHRTFAAGH
jgi:hypothetical protein